MLFDGRWTLDSTTVSLLLRRYVLAVCLWQATADSTGGIGDCTSRRHLECSLPWAGSDSGAGSGGLSSQLTEGMVTVMIPLWRKQLTTPELYYTSNLLFLIAIACSKASVASLLLRLCAEKRKKLLFVGALASNGLLLVASIFAMALQCNVSQPWILVGEKCDGAVSKPLKRSCLRQPADLRSYFAGKS